MPSPISLLKRFTEKLKKYTYLSMRRECVVSEGEKSRRVCGIDMVADSKRRQRQRR